MVDYKRNKRSFWQALILTGIVFALGLVLGFFLEVSRSDKVAINLVNSEINILDDQLRNKIVDDFNVSCELAVKSTFSFADRVYEESLKLDNYDSAAKFTQTTKILHKKYDLLRTFLWLEARELREKCENDFHTVVYIYSYDSEDINIRSKQIFYSRLLTDLKNRNPDKILLIPIAGNMGLESIDLILKSFNIEELPVIIIDEEKLISEIITIDGLEKVVFEMHK